VTAREYFINQKVFDRGIYNVEQRD